MDEPQLSTDERFIQCAYLRYHLTAAFNLAQLLYTDRLNHAPPADTERHHYNTILSELREAEDNLRAAEGRIHNEQASKILLEPREAEDNLRAAEGRIHDEQTGDPRTE